MDFSQFSLTEKKRYVKYIWIGDPYDPYGLTIRMTIRISNPYDLYGLLIHMGHTEFFLFLIVKLIINNFVIFFTSFSNITLFKNEYTND